MTKFTMPAEHTYTCDRCAKEVRLVVQGSSSSVGSWLAVCTLEDPEAEGEPRVRHLCDACKEEHEALFAGRQVSEMDKSRIR